MKHKVRDEAVREYVRLLLQGGPLGDLFPGKMSECDFTTEQREWIKKARTEKKAKLKALKATEPQAVSKKLPEVEPPKAPQKGAGLSKLEKMLCLQGGQCFFCKEPLAAGEASIEHLLPLTHGGTRVESNEVVCHKSVNHAFGSMDLKNKVEFILKSAGKFRCP